MLPVWDALAGLVLYNETQIDALKLVASGQNPSATVPMKEDGPILLSAGGQSVSPSASAFVPQSPETGENARCRVRTCSSNCRCEATFYVVLQCSGFAGGLFFGIDCRAMRNPSRQLIRRLFFEVQECE